MDNKKKTDSIMRYVVYLLCGVLLADDPLYAAYLTEHITKLRRSAEGLRRSSDPDGGRLAAQAEGLADELEERRCKG